METCQQNRAKELASKQIDNITISVDAIALLNIIKQASGQASNRGWGKLLGYYDSEKQTLMIEESYGLLLPKTDEKMRKEDNIDDELKKNCTDFSNNYRQVGFFIFSEDNDIFTFPIINYIVNNEKFGNVKTFLYFSVIKAKLGKNPFTFYEVSDQLNKLLLLKKLDNEKSYYELEEDEIASFDIKNDSLFKETPFKLRKSDVFQNFMHSNLSLFAQVQPIPNPNKNKANENITQNLNEAIHKHAVLVQNYIQNKKTQKKACMVNLFGSYERFKRILSEKHEMLALINQKLQKIEEKISN